MASFLSGREALTPTAMKRKRQSSGQASGDALMSSSQDSEVSFFSDGSSQPKKKKKDKKHKKRKDKRGKEPEEASNAVAEMKIKTEELEEEDEEAAEKPSAQHSPASTASAKVYKDIIKDWTRSDAGTLLERLGTVAQKEKWASWSCQLEHLDKGDGWSQVAFGDHSADDCKNLWNVVISKKVRKFRTLGELVEDAKDLDKQDGGVLASSKSKKQAFTHPDLPKKPLSPYMLFYLAKRSHFSKKFPEMKNSDLTKKMGEEYHKLSDHKKQKYSKQYHNSMEEYKAAVEKFKKDHPQLLSEMEHPSSSSSSKDKDKPEKAVHTPKGAGPPKPTTAQNIYIREKTEAALESDPEQGRRELYNQYQTKWMTKMSDKKKWKYIQLAMEAKKKYDEEMDDYCEKHPDYERKTINTFLTKAEQKIKDAKEGKPKKPPTNGYQMFSIEVMTHATDVATDKRMEEAAKRWGKMTDEKKQQYAAKVKEKQVEYDKALRAYVKTLPEEEKAVYEEELEKLHKVIHGIKAPKTKKKPQKALPGEKKTEVRRPSKPLAPEFIYMGEHKEDLKTKFPAADDRKITRLLMDAYSKLSKKKKVPTATLR